MWSHYPAPFSRIHRTIVSSSAALASRFRLLHRQHISATLPSTYPSAGRMRSMLGDASFLRPSYLKPKSNARPQHGQLGALSIAARNQSVVRISRSNGSPSRRARSIMPCRMMFARAVIGARSILSRRRRACSSLWRSAYNSRRRVSTAVRWRNFHFDKYSRRQDRHVCVRPSRHTLLCTKYSAVAGFCAPQVEQLLIPCTIRPWTVWGNETTRFPEVRT